jgi:hypothetical protein
MARHTLMQRFARWHIWAGWAVAVPVLLWLASGLFMSAVPIEEVRGGLLRAEAPAIGGARLNFPRLTGPVTKVALVTEAGAPTWIITGADAQPRRFNARDGAPLGKVDEGEAKAIATAAFAGKTPLIAMRRFTAEAAPMDLRRPRPSWQATFGDGTHIYVDATSGEVLALRTRFWRAYDFMWGLHIMDLQTREDTSNPFLWVFGGLALVSSLFGTALLFRRRKARK